jgi:hypothetical protein
LLWTAAITASTSATRFGTTVTARRAVATTRLLLLLLLFRFL